MIHRENLIIIIIDTVLSKYLELYRIHRIL